MILQSAHRILLRQKVGAALHCSCALQMVRVVPATLSCLWPCCCRMACFVEAAVCICVSACATFSSIVPPPPTVWPGAGPNKGLVREAECGNLGSKFSLASLRLAVHRAWHLVIPYSNWPLSMKLSRARHSAAHCTGPLFGDVRRVSPPSSCGVGWCGQMALGLLTVCMRASACMCAPAAL